MAVSTRDGAGGVPLDAARPALVSELFVGEAPGNVSAGVFVPGSHGPGIRGSFPSVTVGIANLNEKNGRRAPGYANVNRIPMNPSSCKLKQVVTRTSKIYFIKSRDLNYT